MSLDGVGVFLVEDEPLLAMSVEDMLMELGCKVTASAANLNEAIEMAAGGTFDCALLDVNLAGYEVYPVAEYSTSAAFRSPFPVDMAHRNCRRRSAPDWSCPSPMTWISYLPRCKQPSRDKDR